MIDLSNNRSLWVGWNDPKTYWTPERLANSNRSWQSAGPTKDVMRSNAAAGVADLPQFGGAGMRVAAGYNAAGAQPGQRPRALRTSMAALQRQAARGNPGWGAGGYK
jgi:hypothetical protein